MQQTGQRVAGMFWRLNKVIEWLFLTVPWGCLRFVIVVFPDHTHLLYWETSTAAEEEIEKFIIEVTKTYILPLSARTTQTQLKNADRLSEICKTLRSSKLSLADQLMRFYHPHILNINLGIRGLKVKMSLYLHPHSTLCMRAANALVSLRIFAGSPDPLMLSIAIKIKKTYAGIIL